MNYFVIDHSLTLFFNTPLDLWWLAVRVKLKSTWRFVADITIKTSPVVGLRGRWRAGRREGGAPLDSGGSCGSGGWVGVGGCGRTDGRRKPLSNSGVPSALSCQVTTMKQCNLTDTHRQPRGGRGSCTLVRAESATFKIRARGQGGGGGRGVRCKGREQIYTLKKNAEGG